MPRASGGVAATCEGARLRGLTQSECVAYARHRSLGFIGAQSEANEFAGCVVWGGRTVEFNSGPAPGKSRRRRDDCNVRSKGGECLCTPSG